MFFGTTTRRAALGVAAAVALAVTASAQGAKPITKSEPVTVKATIEAIDQKERTLTLKGPEGYYAIVQAGPEVKRFNQLKVGDVISATYTESVAFSIRQPGAPAPPKEMTGINMREGKPGASATSQRTMSVTIESIDPAVPYVRVKGPEGRVYHYRVRDPKNVQGLKVGDTVDITYTRSLLIKADPASK